MLWPGCALQAGTIRQTPPKNQRRKENTRHVFRQVLRRMQTARHCRATSRPGSVVAGLSVGGQLAIFRRGCSVQQISSAKPSPNIPPTLKQHENLRRVREGAAQGVLQWQAVEAQEEHAKVQMLRRRWERIGAVHEGPREVVGRRLPHLFAAASACSRRDDALYMLHEDSVQWL